MKTHKGRATSQREYADRAVLVALSLCGVFGVYTFTRTLHQFSTT